MKQDPKYWEQRAKTLESVVLAIWWLARRYAHNRRTYAVGQYNDAMRKMQELGIHVDPDPVDGTIWATDGDLGPPAEAGCANGYND